MDPLDPQISGVFYINPVSFSSNRRERRVSPDFFSNLPFSANPPGLRVFFCSKDQKRKDLTTEKGKK
jgi:hypothetical protein